MGRGVYNKSNISTKKSRGTGFGVYMSHAMTGNHVTQPAFSCNAR